ncbi:PREDICTED: activating signal cointegrator 1 [Ceratosolen solmsi marchali]|uniref:Activating signal cointegrator 1 n=1 Tax=Ceratosolen solmsi marchali TaxID=326594 RepID=A0AAJ6VMU4_9HYME|nr:PREDICTED: activating signal cointegrator 1 [Ceratosolen solmsi marchali]
MEKKKKSGSKSHRSKKYVKNKSTLSDLKIRNPCNCEATTHPLVNNCINCGRIVCLSEGPGPCFFCGNIVCYNNEPLLHLNLTEELNDQSKRSIENKSISEINSSKTLKLRDKLLEYDRDCASRTNVIDDECDYFQTNNKWLSKSEQEQWEKLAYEAHEQKHRSRLQKPISIDLTGKVQQTQEDFLLKNFEGLTTVPHKRESNIQPEGLHYNEYQSLEGATYVTTAKLPSSVTVKKNNFNLYRIQDREYLEMLDSGLCLSVHQPYASLIVTGIKKYEERTWYTPHRGRLWIASTSKEIDVEEIKFEEEACQSLHNEKIDFPKTYPVGCLIGCVNVTNVLSQEEYMELYPDRKTSSPYIFIFENFIELPIKYPIQGKHKIYKLDKVIHGAVLNCLEKMSMQMSKKVA